MSKFLIGSLFTIIVCSAQADPATKAEVQASVAQCPFSLGNICFYPAVGAMYGNKKGEEKYKDLRFAAVLHEQLNDNKKHSFGAMIAPGENFIDAAGFGGAYAFIKYADNKYAVLNYGVMAKRHKYEGEEDDIRGGVYLMLSASF